MFSLINCFDSIYIVCLLFLMRWDIVYSNNPIDVLTKNLPYQLLGLGLGIGMQLLISMVLKVQNWRKTVIIGLAYFIILLSALIKTDVLWNRYSNPLITVLIVVIIGLLRIIEKHKIGVFASGNKKHLKVVLCIIFAFFLAVDFAYRIPSEPKFPVVKPATNADAQNLINQNMDKLRGLEEDKWKKLNIRERLDILQTVTNIEASHLGIDYSLNVSANNLGDFAYAYYIDEGHKILVNEKELEYGSVGRILSSVAHECFHAYQRRTIDVYNSVDEKTRKLLLFRQIEAYERESRNYKDGRSDYEGYFRQELETDARSYSGQREAYYYMLLKNCEQGE